MENKPAFETILIKTDVTAVKIVQNDYLLVGIGNTLNLYEISSKRFISHIKIFIGQKIHGLVPSQDENQIAIYGGKEIRTCTININNNKTISKNKVYIQCDDWILTLIWIKNDVEFALLTAHNVVQVWNIISNTLQTSFKCDEKCILYSGLLKECNDSITVFAGTVFSQVVLWHTNNQKVQNRLVGHKGVIFSISYDETNNTIVTTSDDRSVIIWSIERKDITDWSDIKISMKITLFGHTARVMRNEIVGNYIVSIGEDSIMCTWDFDGNLLNKRRIHQDGCLWSLDCNLSKNIAVTGGGDSGVMIHRLVSDLPHINSLDIPSTAKSIAFTARNNIACLTECGKLIYRTNSDEWDVQRWDRVKPCSMFVSICRQFIALTDVNGFLIVLAETCKFEAKLVQCINQKICDGRILSFNWLHDRKFCTCDKNGMITVWGSRADRCVKLNEYYLPTCKERWLTVALTVSDDAFLVGDRYGSIHLFSKQSAHPVQTLTKVHGRLGVNSIKLTDSKITTLGRDGTVKVFNVVNDGSILELQYLCCTKVPFNWVDRFIGKDGTVVCGFRETDLVVWDIEDNQHLTEINCGGGHRSWDVIKKWNKTNDDTIVSYLQFAYIKNYTIHTMDIKVDDFSHNVIRGFHVKEINTLISLKHGDVFTFVSAGEDTMLVFNRCRIDGNTVNFENQLKITKHLSSVRCLYVHKEDERTVIFSAGGRAQICAWELISSNGNDAAFGCKEIGSHLVKGTDLERKGNVGWKNSQVDMDAETRFMSLSCLNIQPYGIILFSGCSDGNLRVYSVNTTFKLIGCYNFNSKCILKVHSIVFETHPIVFTTSTDGTLSIWDFNCITDDIKPVKSMKFHKAGINSFDLSHIGNDKFIMATGGDDNDVQLNVVSFLMMENMLMVSEVCKWSCNKYHCSQITGVKLLNDEYILSASIDQRVTIARLDYDKTTLVDMECKFIGQYHASVSDIQGMTILNHDRNEVLICLYGKGIEIIKINLSS